VIFLDSVEELIHLFVGMNIDEGNSSSLCVESGGVVDVGLSDKDDKKSWMERLAVLRRSKQLRKEKAKQKRDKCRDQLASEKKFVEQRKKCEYMKSVRAVQNVVKSAKIFAEKDDESVRQKEKQNPLDFRRNRENLTKIEQIAVRNEAKKNYCSIHDEIMPHIDMDVFPSEYQLRNFEKDPSNTSIVYFL